MKYYHYSIGLFLEPILSSGHIKPAIASEIGENEKPITWVSTNPMWEYTASKRLVSHNGEVRTLTFNELRTNYGCIRFEINPKVKLYSWKELSKVANISPTDVLLLEDSGVMLGGNPDEWYGTIEPIQSEDWVDIQTLVDGNWISLYSIITD